MFTTSLRSTVRNAILGVGLGVALTATAMISAHLVLDDAREHARFASSLNANVAKLNLLTSELLTHRSQRIFTQWKRQHARLTAQLILPPRFGNHADIIVSELKRRMAEIKLSLEHIEEVMPPEQETAGTNPEIRRVLFTSIIAQSGSIHSRSLELTQVIAQAAERVRTTIFAALGGGFLLVIIVGGLLMSLLSHGLLARILQLRTVIQEIGAGKLDTEIPAGAKDEMGDVLRELDQMRLSLLQMIGELGHVNLQLTAAKSELEDRVAERTAGLEAANRELEAFSYAVSHDLRAPLRTISGFSEAVLEDYGDKLDAEGQSMLRRVHRATGHMSQLIDDLLKLSRLSSAPLDITDVNLSQLVADIGETLRERTPERDVRLKIQPNVIARCDGRLMTITLTNLMENAWKFTNGAEPAEIEFSRHFDKDRATYVLADNGAGFEMAYSDKLFQPFQRLHSAEQFPGTGIGLATVARIIRRHNGDIWAESQPGEGARFSFHLGVCTARKTPPADEQADPSAQDTKTGAAALARVG